MKKMLMIASVPSMIGQFNMNNIEILLDLGYEVNVACDWNDRSVWKEDKINALKNKFRSLNIMFYQVDFSRDVKKINRHIKAYRQLVKLLENNNYDFIHCHSPIGGAISRLACEKTNTKCVYTAHGFHFYKGAPIQNWLLFYPIEKLLSKYTDVLITINNEDYNRARDKFKMNKIEYIPGVGVDINKFHQREFNRDVYRSKLGYKKDDFVILSVGELNENKNHEIIIKAMAKFNNPRIHYMIAGKGNMENYLLNLSTKLRLSNNVKLLGYRKDIVELNLSADVFAFPSKREGLGLAAIEAMATGIPLITSNIHGINDYSVNGLTGYSCDANDEQQYADAINWILLDEDKDKYKITNTEYSKKYDINVVNKKMIDIYSKI